MCQRITPTPTGKSTPKEAKKRKKRPAPLPIRDGLNPSRVRFPDHTTPIPAIEFIDAVIDTQRYRHPEDDLEAVKARFASGTVVDREGKAFSATDLIRPGTDVWFYRIPAPEPRVPYEVTVVHEDERLLVVDKPPFLATFPRGSHITESVLVRMRTETGNPDLSPAHRLDRLTSGVLVLTKTREARGAYQTLFAERRVDKVYEAIATHLPEITPGTVWQHRMEKERGEFQTRIEDGPINAITEVNSVTPLLDEENREFIRTHQLVDAPRLARYELHPLTGRTHQLRVHMLLAGAPILGDPIYPDVLPVDAEDFAIPLHLLSRSLRFEDPFTGETREFISER